MRFIWFPDKILSKYPHNFALYCWSALSGHLRCSEIFKHCGGRHIQRRCLAWNKPESSCPPDFETYGEAFFIRRFVIREKGLPYLNIETNYSQADKGKINTHPAAFLEIIDK